LNNTNTSIPNSERVKYGWRVKQTEFGNWVLAEYTTFWHHPNGKCYRKTGGWVKDPPQDPSTGGSATPAAGSADPKDGTFSGGGGSATTTTTTTTTTTVDGVTTTTTTITYANGQTYVRTVATSADGTETVTETMPDGAQSTSTQASPNVEGSLGRPLGPRPPPFDQTNTAPFEQVYTPEPGAREAWRELTQ
jgi:hypothetical protein